MPVNVKNIELMSVDKSHNCKQGILSELKKDSSLAYSTEEIFNFLGNKYSYPTVSSSLRSLVKLKLIYIYKIGRQHFYSYNSNPKDEVNA